MSSAAIEDRSSAPAVEFKGARMADATVLNLVGYVAPMVIGFLAIPFLIRWLGVERFGVLSLVWVLAGYFAVFDLGLGLATTKFVAEALGRGETKDIAKIIWNATAIQTGLGLLAAAVMAVITPILVDHAFKIPAAYVRDAKTAFLLIAVSLPAGLVSGSLRGALEASQKFGWVNAVKIPTNAGSYLLPLLGAGLGMSLTGIVALLVLLRVANSAIHFVLLAKIYPGLRRWISWDKAMVRTMLKFGGWVTVSNFAWPVFIYLDRMLIGALIGVQAVSYYTAPYEVVTRFGVISGSLWMTIFPAFSALEARRDRVQSQRLFDRSQKYLLISVGTVMILAVAYGRFFMTLWLGEEYGRHCITVFQLLGVGFLAESLATVAIGYLQAVGRADITAKWNLLEIFFYVPVVWLLIKRHGIEGAAAAYLLRALVNLGLMMGSVAKTSGMRVFSPVDRSLVRAWKAFLLLTSLVVIGQALGLEDFASVAYTTPLALVYALVVWRVVLEADERTWILARVKSPFGGKAAG